MNKRPSNLQEFVKEYLFNKEVELLKKETEIQRLKTQITQITNSIKCINERYKNNNLSITSPIEICGNCFKIVYDKINDIDLNVTKCLFCEDNFYVCHECYEICGGIVMELPYMAEYWICNECYDKSDTYKGLMFIRVGKNE